MNYLIKYVYTKDLIVGRIILILITRNNTGMCCFSVAIHVFVGALDCHLLLLVINFLSELTDVEFFYLFFSIYC